MLNLNDLKVEIIYGFGTPHYKDYKHNTSDIEQQLIIEDNDIFNTFHDVCINILNGNYYTYNHNYFSKLVFTIVNLDPSETNNVLFNVFNEITVTYK